MAEKPEIKCKVECKCGWTKVFSSQFSGIIIECPECGKTHLIPTFEGENLDESIDMATMNRLLEQQQESPAGDGAPVTVLFKPLFVMALVFAVVAAVVAFVLVRPVVPHAVAVAGGALSWPLGIGVAWLGQRRQRRKVVGAEPDHD